MDAIQKNTGERQEDQQFWYDLIDIFEQSRDLLKPQSDTADNKYPDFVCPERHFLIEQKSKGIPLDEAREYASMGKIAPFEQEKHYCDSSYT